MLLVVLLLFKLNGDLLTGRDFNVIHAVYI